MRLLALAVVAVLLYLVWGGKQKRAAAAAGPTLVKPLPDAYGKAQPALAPSAPAPSSGAVSRSDGTNVPALPSNDGTSGGWEDDGSSMGIEW